MLIVAGAALLTVLEPATVGKNYWAGIWWAIVTTTTVGYGDIVPASTAGRIAAVVLMLTGIGFVSTLSAPIAAYFIEQDERLQIAKLDDRLHRVELLLETIHEALTSRGR